MNKVQRMERVIALSKYLAERPFHLFPFNYFCELFAVAKSTLSEDMLVIKSSFEQAGLGTIETVAGAAGGVRYIPNYSSETIHNILKSLGERLCEPERIIPGGFLYMSDILYTPHLMIQVGQIFMTMFKKTQPDYIMTVETKGIPLALMTARAFDVPLLTARRGSKVTEGSVVTINYVTGSSRRIATMSLPKRSLPQGARVLIIDDFMKAGGTAKGMSDLAKEFGAEVIGTGILIATSEPAHKLIDDYLPLFILDNVDEHNKKTVIRPNL